MAITAPAASSLHGNHFDTQSVSFALENLTRRRNSWSFGDRRMVAETKPSCMTGELNAAVREGNWIQLYFSGDYFPPLTELKGAMKDAMFGRFFASVL